MTDCAEAMDAVAAAVRGDLASRRLSRLEAHLRGCVRCREAHTDALACAGALLPPPAGGQGPRDPVAWERGLFVRLLQEADGGAGRGRRAPGWARLALRLGRAPAEGGISGWQRWRRGPEGGASRY